MDNENKKPSPIMSPMQKGILKIAEQIATDIDSAIISEIIKRTEMVEKVNNCIDNLTKLEYRNGEYYDRNGNRCVVLDTTGLDKDVTENIKKRLNKDKKEGKYTIEKKEEQ